jgi:hypothetical protein
MDWEIQPHTGADKSFDILFRGAPFMTVDYDDVEHDVVDALVGELVDSLNEVSEPYWTNVIRRVRRDRDGGLR